MTEFDRPSSNLPFQTLASSLKVTMSAAQQKQRGYAQLSQTIQHISKELNLSRELLGETARQLQAMGRFGALSAAQ